MDPNTLLIGLAVALLITLPFFVAALIADPYHMEDPNTSVRGRHPSGSAGGYPRAEEERGMRNDPGL